MISGKQRVKNALSHEETDRVPIDLGGSQATGIHIRAYKSLLQVLGYDPPSDKFVNIIGQTAKVSEKVLEHFCIDTRAIFPEFVFQGDPIEDKDGFILLDDFGVKWRMPKPDGLYYDIISSPLANSSLEDVLRYKWPDAKDERRFGGIDSDLEKGGIDSKAIIFGGTIANGFLQTGNWLEGFEDFLCDLVEENEKAEYILDKIFEIKISYWDTVLDKWGGILDVIQEQDDYGAQQGLLISPELFRKKIKPRYSKLFDYIKKRKPGLKILFHSCGSIRPIIPDLIEMGVDALNPVQINANDMDAAMLKKDFGKDITFWGGGIDSQGVLPKGTPSQVEYEVKKMIEIFAPGGGFVFAPVHNIQADVPPENLISMWETVLKS
ncbi:MAG: uroporphyrinogen decarboxylase family protein [Saccharofermentanales bacterium]